MKNIFLLLLCNSLIFAAGYQVPNNSMNSYALATAYVANANGADAAYFNPANMVYNEDIHELEASISYILLPSMKYSPINGATPIETQKYDTVIPAFHYVSPKLAESGIRIGLSVAVPYGLTREWSEQPASATAKKFALQTIEINPSIALPITKELSVAFGIRYIQGKGEVELEALPTYSVNMSGDDDAFAYNIALSYKATDALQLALTYRSALTLTTSGDAAVSLGALHTTTAASLDVEVPDNLILAAAYKLSERTTLEITYDKTFWSKVTKIDFNYANPTIEGALGGTTTRLWDDTTAYRLGVTHKLDDTLTLMGGIAYSTNAAEEKYVSYSSPEADSMTYAFGGRFAYSDRLDIGLSVLYADYQDRTSTQTSPTGVQGTFSNKSAFSLTTGIGYKF